MSGGSQKFNMKTVMNSESDGAASHIITGLRKYTEYEVFLMPFYKMMEGQPSNSLHIQTLEDVPSGIFIMIFYFLHYLNVKKVPSNYFFMKSLFVNKLDTYTFTFSLFRNKIFMHYGFYKRLFHHA